MDFFEAVQRRRSIRRYTATPVPAQVMANAFEAAQLAPNSSNLQTCEFYWVRSAEPKERLAKACLSQGAARTAAELVVVVSQRRNWKRNNQAVYEGLEQIQSPVVSAQRQYYGKLIPFVYGYRWLAPLKWLLFNGIGLVRPIMRGPVTGRDLDEVSIKSAALAAQSFMLAISAQGFDTCPMEGFDEPRVRRILKLRRSARVVMVISVGERAPKGLWGSQFRLPREHFMKEI